MRLCQHCLRAWNNRQYCFYCYSIYKDSNINSSGDGKSWIMCDGCSSWVTIDLINVFQFNSNMSAAKKKKEVIKI
jgi:hypothetical protein